MSPGSSSLGFCTGSLQPLEHKTVTLTKQQGKLRSSASNRIVAMGALFLFQEDELNQDFHVYRVNFDFLLKVDNN